MNIAFRLLLLFGLACAVIVVLAHVAERFRIFPGMGWGLSGSPAHYLDLVSAIFGGVSLLGAFALRVAAATKKEAAN